MKKIIIATGFFMGGLLLSTISVLADTVSVNFENPPYQTGVIDGQDGWTSKGAAGSGCALYDQKVDGSFGFSTFGSQSFRVSDAVTSGCFGDQAFAKPLINAVGETSATTGSFSEGVRQTHFETQFDIASTVPNVQQAGLHISVSPDRGDGSRMSYLRFEDGTNGIDVFFDDVPSSTVDGTGHVNFVETKIGDGLDRTKIHTIKLVMDTIDGPSNDVVKVYIDGSLVISGTSWENYYSYDSEASAEQSPRIVKTVIFRSSGTAVPADLNKGFLFDNLTLASGPVLVGPPTSVDQCKKGVWKTFNNPTFKNQGECVSYVVKHNKPAKAAGGIRMSNPKQRMIFSAFDYANDPSKDKGEVEYWNFDYPGLLHYKAKILCADIDKTTKEGRFMFQVPSGWPGLSGFYVVSYVKDNGNPGTKDLYGHTATGDLNTAKDWCENGTNFTMYPVTGGNLVVHK